MSTFAPPTPTISHLAGSLLRAWVRADRNQLLTELDKSALASLCIQNECEEERLELLQTIAARMRSCPSLLASRSEDPGLDLCVDLLVHLAGMTAYCD